MVALGFGFILLTGIFFSFSRAAWFSIAFMILAAVLLYFNIRFRFILSGIAVILALAWFNKQDLLVQMQGNRSMRSSNIQEHITSATNISTSVSNKERLNRWKSAFRMIEDRPFLGFGPGTYQFQYGTYQLPQDMTRISSYHGEKGGVHSEFLKPFVESGVFGFITFMGIILSVGFAGMRVSFNAPEKDVRITSTAALAGLIGYMAHGFVNYFTHTSKVAVLFWGLAAFLVVMDCRNKKHYSQLKQAGAYKSPF